MSDSTNPLQKYFRVPKIFIKLPSEGRHYPPGAFEPTPTGEIPVYSMTAKDELLLKTPDALISGQSTVDVIQSCVPNIKNAWVMPSIDIDAVLIAIRQATYGNRMDFVTICPHCKQRNEHALDLGNLFTRIVSPNYSETIKVGKLEFIFKPQNFKNINDASRETFEQQRLLSVVANDALSDQEKSEKFNNMFSELLNLTVKQIADGVAGIKTETGELVQNPVFVHEFFKNCEKHIWQAVKAHIDKLSESMATKQINVTCENDECKKPYTSPLIFEQSSFFV